MEFPRAPAQSGHSQIMLDPLEWNSGKNPKELLTFRRDSKGLLT